MSFVLFVFSVTGVSPSSHARQVFRAKWILPISQAPIENGWVEVQNGRVIRVGSTMDAPNPHLRASRSGGQAEPRTTSPDIAILPGLVNAHTHLELSWMRGQVPPAPSMPQWVERLMALRRTVGHEPQEPIVDAIRELQATGTALLGDVSNTLAAYPALADSGVSAAIFLELLGFNVEDPTAVLRDASGRIDALREVVSLRTSIVPHAPYSVSPSLLRAIASESKDARVSMHVGESREEIEFLRTGEGAWRTLLTSMGAWTDGWRAPGTGPVDYVAAQGLLNDRFLAIHCVQLTDRELGMLASAGATVVTCPRSNRWVGAGVPPIERFYRSGVRVAIGTDSLASVEDLNLFSELSLMRKLAPSVPAREILASATKHGADALGFGDEFGTIEPGKRASLIAVAVPDDVSDVEEYLVNGVLPGSIQRLDW